MTRLYVKNDTWEIVKKLFELIKKILRRSYLVKFDPILCIVVPLLKHILVLFHKYGKVASFLIFFCRAGHEDTIGKFHYFCIYNISDTCFYENKKLHKIECKPLLRTVWFPPHIMWMLLEFPEIMLFMYISGCSFFLM